MFAVTGYCGTLVFGASVRGNMLLSLPFEDGAALGVLSTVARIATILNVLGCCPLQMHPARASLSQMLWERSPYQLSSTTYAALTGVLFLVTWAIAMAVPGLAFAVACIG